jgi:DHA1 family tetracycline resistance protein-like MFS transporter
LNKKLLLSIFLIVFIDLLGFSLILPLLPFYAETFGASPGIIGLLVASYAAAQLVGAPILGRLSDRYGRRPLLIVSIAGDVIAFIILGFAHSLPVLFFSRILSGITGGNISIAQAYISDVTDTQNRARGLGMIGAAFGLGFIIGPAAGGLLSRFGYSVPTFVAAGLASINVLMILFWLPESLTQERRQALTRANRPPFTFKAMLTTLRRPFVGPLLHTRFFFAMAFSLFQTIFALYGQARFNLNAQSTGYILAYVGVLAVIVQGGLVGRLAKRYHETQLIFWATCLMTVGLLGWAFAPSILFLLLALIPTSLAGGVLNTVINSTISKSVAPIEIGGTLGLSSSLESLTRVIAPTLGGLLLQTLGASAPGIVASIITTWLATYVYRFILCKGPAPVAQQVFGE